MSSKMSLRYPSQEWFLVSLIVFTTHQMAGGTEYCWEDFNATCAEDEVILMRTALYGRMKIGRCLNRDYYVGCHSDVTYFMDKKCSGRHSCTVPIPDTSLQNEVACPKDLVAYLNATHECVKVGYPKGGNTVNSMACTRSTKSTLIKATEFGYISSLVSVEAGAGIDPCPWIITVPMGQKINISLLDFSVNKLDKNFDDICAMYATLRESGETSTDIMVCGGETREKVVYLSDSNSVAIEINSALAQNKANMPYFLLKYSPVGCPDIESPSGGWVQRQGHKVAMGCNNTREVRHLVCNGNSWVGEPSNCSGAHLTGSQDAHGFVRKDVPFGLVLAIVIGIILGIVIGSMLLGVVLFTQNKWKRRRQPPGVSCVSGPMDQEKTQILQSGTYGYAHVWELQQLRGGCEHPETTLDQCTMPRAVTTTCPAEFGSHLGKPPGFISSKDHSYESPRTNPSGLCHSGHRIPDIHQGTPIQPNCHEFDLHIKTTVPGTENNQEARYTD